MRCRSAVCRRRRVAVVSTTSLCHVAMLSVVPPVAFRCRCHDNRRLSLSPVADGVFVAVVMPVALRGSRCRLNVVCGPRFPRFLIRHVSFFSPSFSSSSFRPVRKPSSVVVSRPPPPLHDLSVSVAAKRPSNPSCLVPPLISRPPQLLRQLTFNEG